MQVRGEPGLPDFEGLEESPARTPLRPCSWCAVLPFAMLPDLPLTVAAATPALQAGKSGAIVGAIGASSVPLTAQAICMKVAV